MIGVDLHAHSTASDGFLSPRALMERAAGRGLPVVALTDHDTLTGLAEAALAASEFELRFIPGVEVSANWEGRTLHVLGLGIDTAAPALIEALDRQTELRTARGLAIAGRLERLGFKAAADRAMTMSSGASIGRAHFARALVETGVTRNEEAAFKRYLRPGRPAHVAGGWIELDEAVAALLAAGGQAVLAHPMRYNLSQTAFRRLMEVFVAAGGTGLELGPARLSAAELDTIVGACHRHRLRVSLGSDFHGPGPVAELGTTASLPDRMEVVWEHWGIERLPQRL